LLGWCPFFLGSYVFHFLLHSLNGFHEFRRLCNFRCMAVKRSRSKAGSSPAASDTSCHVV
jgi:hypothetical protein